MVIFFNMHYCEVQWEGKNYEISKHWKICLASKSFIKNALTSNKYFKIIYYENNI